MMAIRRGDIYWCNLDPAMGHEENKTRPFLIIQNDIGNTYSPTTIGVVLTSEFDEREKRYPTNVLIIKDFVNKLEKDSLIETSQIRVIDSKKRLGGKIGCLDRTNMMKVDEALKYSLDLYEKCPKCNYIITSPIEKCPRCKLILFNKCSNCGKLLDVHWKFCPHCGKEVKI